jgi:hypothetical protein
MTYFVTASANDSLAFSLRDAHADSQTGPFRGVFPDNTGNTACTPPYVSCSVVPRSTPSQYRIGCPSTLSRPTTRSSCPLSRPSELPTYGSSSLPQGPTDRRRKSGHGTSSSTARASARAPRKATTAPVSPCSSSSSCSPTSCSELALLLYLCTTLLVLLHVIDRHCSFRPRCFAEPATP